MEKERTYLCIDMKTFYASVECAERGLNPFETNLVVADLTRGKNALCLAITPQLKSMGIKNRCRISEIPASVKYIVAPPRMSLYIEYAADIYAIYLNYFSSQDIHVYSIDESFIDVTDYLKLYDMGARAMARFLINEILEKKGIPSTVGIGTNLYLAKVALDITAKHTKSHIGFLTEDIYKEKLWKHRPITDFWQIAKGTAARLSKYGVYDMEGIARAPQELLYKEFGINAELLIDHAYGRESCLMEDIKNYKSKSKSVSFSQILPRDYTYEEARVVLNEMLFNGTRELMKRKVITNKLDVIIGYSKELIPATGGSIRMTVTTQIPSLMQPYLMRVYEQTTEKDIPIRRSLTNILKISVQNTVKRKAQIQALINSNTRCLR
jgi:DNA polymerase V